MKNSYYFLTLCYFFISCHSQNLLDEPLNHSIQRLNDLDKNRTSDTFALRGALDTAYQIALKVSDLQHDSLFASVSRLYGNALYDMDGSKAQVIYKKGLYNNIAQLYHLINDYKMALVYFDSVKINSQATDAQNLKLNFLRATANCYNRLNDFHSAEQIYLKAEPVAIQLCPIKDLGSFYTEYSICLNNQKKYQEATQKAEMGRLLFQNSQKTKLII
jgi:tetratricopeptide (TPR) repeat protein